MIRPSLSEDSFLKHLFSPSKNPLPTGIRKRNLTGTKGRKKGRLTAYNRMSGRSQELLRQSGLRDAYLSGTATLADARKTLRNVAVSKGYAKPLRPKPFRGVTGETLDERIAGYVYRTMTGDMRPDVSFPDLRDRVTHLPEEIKPEVLKWSSGRIRAYAGNEDNIVTIDGKNINPLWYHHN